MDWIESRIISASTCPFKPLIKFNGFPFFIALIRKIQHKSQSIPIRLSKYLHVWNSGTRNKMSFVAIPGPYATIGITWRSR